MKPVLFATNATSFNTNGIGSLDAISCSVTEERNGIYELELTIAKTAAHASNIEMGSIIKAKPSQGKNPQPFRVYKITKPINGKFSVYAQHISYQLSFIPVMPFTVAASASACNSALQGLKTNAAESCPFTFWTDVVTAASYNQPLPASLRSRLGGVTGSILDQFGGEYEWDGYTVKLWRNRGLTSPSVTLRYGKNITDLKQEENIQNTITGIVPYWSSSEGDTVVTLTEKVVDSSTAGNYPFKRTVPYDFSQDFETPPTQAQLRARAQAYVNASGIGIPKVSIEVSFINLSDTEDYKNIAALQVVNLCDTVGVYFEKLGISTTAKVVKTVYDVLKEKYISVQIGDLKSTLAGTIADTSGALTAVANNARNMFKNYNNTVTGLIDNATSWLTSSGGYVIAVKNQDGSWKELLFMSTNDITDTHAHVLRVNENGLGFSSTGVAGPYTQAWTLDGKLVIGGTNVPSLTVYDNQNHILFQINKDGMEWNAANSNMTKAGVLTAQGATLKGGSLTIVQNVNGTEVEIFKVSNTGKLTVKNTSNVTLFDVDRDGVSWNESGTQGGVTVGSSMTKSGYFTATGATFTNCSVVGGTIHNESEGSFIDIAHGDFWGGVNGEGNRMIHLDYHVSGNECICLEGNGIAFASNDIYVRDSRSGSYYRGDNGSYVKSVSLSGVSVETETIYDFYGQAHTVVTGVSGGGGSVSTGSVVHGICIG